VTEPSAPVSPGPSQDKQLELPPGQQPQVVSTSRAFQFIRTRAGRYAALVFVALAVSYIAGALLFRAAGYRKGYRVGRESVGYFEGAAIADSMKADASHTVLGLAGLMPDSGQYGLWHVARFGLTPAKALCKYGDERALDTMRVPTFSEHALAQVLRSYRSGSDGRIHYVDR